MGSPSCPKVSITISTSGPPLLLWGAGHRVDWMGHPRSSPLRKPQSHAGHGAAISIPLTWGSCRALSPPHLLLHVSTKYLRYLGPETHRWRTGLYLPYMKYIQKSPITSNSKRKSTPENQHIQLTETEPRLDPGGGKNPSKSTNCITSHLLLLKMPAPPN